jgi:hypothetical protein
MLTPPAGADPALEWNVQTVTWCCLLPAGQTQCVSVPISRPLAPYQRVEFQFNSNPNAFTASWSYNRGGGSMNTEFWRPLIWLAAPVPNNAQATACATNTIPNLADPQGRIWVNVSIRYDTTPVGATAVNTNQTSYSTGESPLYAVSGPANSPIYWTSWKDGAGTGETNAFYGQYTDGNGYWQGYGAPWQSGNVGSWMKQVAVGAASSTVSFSVH